MTPDADKTAPPADPRRAGVPVVRLTLAAVLGALLVLALWPAVRAARAFLARERVERATLTILRSEELTFLATDRLVSQISVEITENSPLLGIREGVLIATVRLYYGIDLRRLGPASVSRAGRDRLVVRLPDPEPLDFAVDPASFKYITKRSGLNVIRDFALNKDLEAELRTRLQPHAMRFFTEQGLLPTRASVARRLREYAAPLGREWGVVIDFQ